MSLGLAPLQIEGSEPRDNGGNLTIYLAAGGPGDLVVASALSNVSTSDRFISFAWRRSASIAGYSPWAALQGVDRTNLGAVDHEAFRIDGAKDQLNVLAHHLPGILHLLDLDDLQWSREVLRILVDEDPDKRLVLVDAGGDVLGNATHKGLRSPLLEAIAIRLTTDVGLHERTEVVAAGLGVDNELSQAEIRARLANLPHRECSVGPQALDLLGTFDAIDSEAGRLWLSARGGRRGRVWCDGGGRPIHLNDFAARAIQFPLRALLRNPGLAVRPKVASIGEANADLVASGYIDEMGEISRRDRIPSDRARYNAIRHCRAGDYVTNRFKQRYGSEMLTVTSVGDGLLSKIEGAESHHEA